MVAFTGLTGIAGYQVLVDRTSQASPEDRSGGTVDEKHSERGETARPYSWESQMTPGGSHGPYGPENQLLGDPDWVWQPAGDEYDDPTFDHTPATRAAPFPVVLSGPAPSQGPDDVARQLQQSMRIHAVNLGASAKMIDSSQAPLNDTWDGFYNVNPGSDDLEAPGSEQARSSPGFMFGSTDRTTSFARQNAYGYDSAHQLRRYATGEIVGNNMWLRPGGRVMRKTLAGPARPAIGIDSPFYGQDLGQTYSVGGAILLDAPREYEPPPTPYLAQPSESDIPSDALVEWY